MKGIFIGIRHRPWPTLAYLFASFSVLWTLVEGFTYFIPLLDLRGTASLITVAVIGIIYAVAVIRQPSKIEIPILHTNTRIEIKFGDLFEEDGFRVIPVNEFFDSEIGPPISAKSLHGIFLSKCFGGHSQAFDQIIKGELKDSPGENVTRPQGKTRKYPIGTTATIPVNNDHYLCFAVTKTEIDTCKANADVPTLWHALSGLWEKARISLGGSALVLPLVGSGLSGIDLPTRQLLDLIILSVITESKRRQITARVRIILTPNRYNEVDLRELKRHWR
ncbi:MAG: hypothetical protein KAV87_58915 [Desulfobacteraceae bacterium]|nr:hypothetical protein [Desulfobacteraceae bacterium]